MTDIAAIKQDIAKMIDLGAPEADIDAYVAAHGLTALDLQPTATEKAMSAVEGLSTGAQKGFQKIGTGIIQTGAENLGFPETAALAKKAATRIENESIANKQKNPVAGSIGEMLPYIVSSGGTSLPSVVGGSAAFSGLAPKPDQSQVTPYEGTAFERALAPIGKGVSSIVEAVGLDPNSRLGQAAAGGIMGAGAYGAGKSGSAILSAANKGGKALTRGLTKIDQNAVEALQQSGIEPTLSLVSDSYPIKASVNTLQKLPLVGNRLEEQGTKAVSKLERNVSDIANKLGTAANLKEGGEALQQGIKSYKQRTGDIADKLSTKRDALIPPETKVQIPQTQQFAKEYLGKYADTPELAKTMLNPDISARSTALLNDGAYTDLSSVHKSIPYSTLKNLRIDIGAETKGIPSPATAPYKQMYGALSEDMFNAAKGVSPDAGNAAIRFNNFYRGLMQRNEKLGKFVNEYSDGTLKIDPEKFATANRADLTLLRKSIPKENFNDYASSVVRSMGEATAGMQGATGEVFSPNTFLTNFNKLNKSGKADVIFGKETSSELMKAARVAERFKRLGNAANTSNTANTAVATGSMYGMFIKPLATATIGMPAYGVERLLTSPKALRVINNYAYRPVITSAKVGNEFAVKLMQAAGQDVELRNATNAYLERLKQPMQVPDNQNMAKTPSNMNNNDKMVYLYGEDK